MGTSGKKKKKRKQSSDVSREKKTDQKIKDILILVRVAKRLAISLLHHHNVKPFVVKVRGVSQKLGEDYQTFTRKLHLTTVSNCVIGTLWNQESFLPMKTHVKIVFKAQLFESYNALICQNTSNCIYKQNFLCLICQLVTGKCVAITLHHPIIYYKYGTGLELIIII